MNKLEVAKDREVWASLLKLLPRDMAPDKQKKMDGAVIKFRGKKN